MFQKACRLYLVRHAQSAVNAKASEPGQFDALGSPLTTHGRAQAQALAVHFAPVVFRAVFSSHLRRALETAQILAGEQDVQTPPLLRERDRHPQTSQARETPEEVVARLLEALRAIAQRYMGETVLVVSHGFVMRAFLVALDYTTFTALPEGAIENMGYVVLMTDGEQFRVESVVGVKQVV